MTIDIHALLEKNPITKKMFNPNSAMSTWDHTTN